MRFGSVARSWLAASGFMLAMTGAQIARAETYGPNGPSNVITNDVIVLETTDLTNTNITERIDSTLGGSGIVTANRPGFDLGGGKAAGSEPRNFGIWANVANTWVRNSQPGAEFNGPVTALTAGLDYKFENSLLFGIAGTYERSSIYTGFNNGNQASNGGVVTAYAAYRLTQNFSIDGEVGHGWIGYSGSHGGVTNSFNGDRWFGAANIKASTAIEAWRLSGSLGYFHVAETQNAFTESNGNAVPSSMPYLGQVRLKGQVGYQFDTNFGSLTPFASARLEYDASHGAAPVINAAGQRAARSEFGTTFGVGVRAELGDYTSLVVEGRASAFREYFEAYGINASLRLRF